jgi:hypothetical protein
VITGAAASLPTASTGESALASTPSKPVELTIEVNGDVLIHSQVWQQALRDGHGRYDFSPMLREIAPYLKRADLAICHVETPMTPRAPEGYPVFNTPTQLAGPSGKRDGACATPHRIIRSIRASMGSTRPTERSIEPGCCTPARSCLQPPSNTH